MKAWRGQHARRIIAESAAGILPKSQFAAHALPNRRADTSDHRAVAAMGFLSDAGIYPDDLRAVREFREPVTWDRLPTYTGVSLQPAIPRRVAPQQSPLPLHRSPAS